MFRREKLISASFSKTYWQSFRFIILIIAACILFSTNAYTKGVVSGRYISVTENTIKFVVNVSIPAPANLIIHHFHPAQTILLNTIPQASKVNNEDGSAKWFLKSVKPGKISFTLSFKKHISENDIRVILRYSDPSTGNFIESTILP